MKHDDYFGSGMEMVTLDKDVHGAFGRVDHIGIAVQSLDSYHSLYRDILGGVYIGSESVSDEGVKVAMYQFGTETKIELLEPTSDDSAIARYLSKRGEGIHHIAFSTYDIRLSLKLAEQSGYRIIPGYPKTGAQDCQVAFLHPKTTGKTLVELLQPGGCT